MPDTSPSPKNTDHTPRFPRLAALVEYATGFVATDPHSDHPFLRSGTLLPELGYVVYDPRNAEGRPENDYKVKTIGNSNDLPTLGGHKLIISFSRSALGFAYTIGGHGIQAQKIRDDRIAGIVGNDVRVINVTGALKTERGLFSLERFYPDKVQFYGRDIDPSSDNILKLAKIWLECATGPHILPRQLEIMDSDMPVSPALGDLDRFVFSHRVNLSRENRAAIANLLRLEDTQSRSADSESLPAAPAQAPAAQ